jgi:hypothetical protein
LPAFVRSVGTIALDAFIDRIDAEHGGTTAATEPVLPGSQGAWT